jgi:hypothetical protein
MANSFKTIHSPYFWSPPGRLNWRSNDHYQLPDVAPNPRSSSVGGKFEIHHMYPNFTEADRRIFRSVTAIENHLETVRKAVAEIDRALDQIVIGS